MNAHTITPARLQSLIKGLDPAKVTPELQAMIAAHMAHDAKQAERERGRKPGAKPAVNLEPFGPKLTPYRPTAVSVLVRRANAILAMLRGCEMTTQEIFDALDDSVKMEKQKSLTGFLSDMRERGALECDYLTVGGGKRALWRLPRQEAAQ